MDLQGRKPKIKMINGIQYAYDVQSVWDKENKKYIKKSTYLGKVSDIDKLEIIPKKEKITTPKMLLNFGDSYSIANTLDNCIFRDCIKQILPKEIDTLASLICYKMLKSSSMQYAETWSEGNYVSLLYKKANLSSQRISEFLKKLGNEAVWREFFASYIGKIIGDKTGVIVDSTGLPNEINFPLSAWGHHGRTTERETRLLMVVERTTGQPLYFSYKAGNIVDVSTLTNTIAELAQIGVNTSFALVDAGYYSAENIKALFDGNIAFLTRLPAGRTLYKTLVNEHSDTLETAKNRVVYGDRSLYIKCVEVDLFGHKGYAYLACDIKRKGDETNKFLIEAQDDKLSDDEIEEKLKYKGKFAVVSSEKLPVDEVLPLYYTRQSAENLFGVSKSFLDILPLRTHSVDTFRGYLMLNFLSLIVFIEMKKLLKGKFTVERALMEMTNLLCSVYTNEVIVCEPTKKMKAVAELLGFSVPIKLGV